MSDHSDVFNFQEVADDGLDIDAIFGGSTDAPSDPPPLTNEPQPAPADETPRSPQSDVGSEPASANAGPVMEVPATEKPDAEQDLFSAFSGNDAANPSMPEEKRGESTPVGEKKVSLFDKPAVFKYGSAREPITDASLTFEELRIQKADDFPELEEGKKVSWTVKYGDVTKSIPLPKETTIAKIKEEIEKSKAFLDSLKKGKVKDPECLVTPKVTAGSKGIAAYKGVYPTVEAARQSDKVIGLIPSSNGRIYELRKTELGEFVAPKNKIVDFNEVRAGFTPALPLIPRELMGQIFSFFRSFMGKRGEFEAMAQIYWDREEEEFVPHIPRQRTSKAHIAFQMDDGEFPEERYLLYADIHSHNSMAAEFSPVDDEDEKATRLYIVVGRLHEFYPSICARVSCGGSFLEIDPGLVIEGIGEEFPVEWLDQVERKTKDDFLIPDSSTTKRGLEVIFQ